MYITFLLNILICYLIINNEITKTIFIGSKLLKINSNKYVWKLRISAIPIKCDDFWDDGCTVKQIYVKPDFKFTAS